MVLCTDILLDTFEDIFLEPLHWVKSKITRIDGSTLKKIAEINGCSIEGVRSTINSFPLELAKAILYSPRDGEFDLRPIEDYPAI
jgi:hypothetical protein